MPKTTTALETPLRRQLDRLATFEPTDADAPVLSVYLDMRSNQEGREHYSPFLRKALTERAAAFKGAARRSFEQDTSKISDYLGNLLKSLNGLAIFACAARDGFFEAIELHAPIDRHWLFVGPVPHLYPLARINDQYPRYAALIVDTNSARLFVFSLGMVATERQVQNVRTRKTSMGGWSQARYQRHIENFHQQHMKEVVQVLERVVRDEALTQIVVACDDVARPLLMEEMPQHLADKIIDVVRLDMKTPEHQILSQTLEALRQKDADTDSARVQAMMGAWRAGGLAVAGPEETLKALMLGQVEELLITTNPTYLKVPKGLPQNAATGPIGVATSPPGPSIDSNRLSLADELVKKAQQQSARIRFIEDPSLLEDVGGVGALLRFKIEER
jgi:peptide chain release factor subunit 1